MLVQDDEVGRFNRHPTDRSDANPFASP